MRDQRGIYRRAYGHLPLLLLLMVLSACGPGNPLGRRPIDGCVTFDGKPLESGSIQFISQRPDGLTSGAMIAQGAYRLDVQHGLPPGKYSVQISSPQIAAGAITKDNSSKIPAGLPSPSIERIAPKYNSASVLTVEVTTSGSIQFDFETRSK